MAWQHRLPHGVRHAGGSSQGFTLSVSLPVGDGLAPLHCPAATSHGFKVAVTQGAAGESSDCYCPYCGTRAATDEFLADQLPRLNAAAEAAAEQYVDQALDDILSKAFGKRAGPRSRSDLFDISISYQPGRPPPRRSLPTYEIEPTRRTMRCNRCSEAFAVYGLAIYCPTCGQLAPAQQFVELIRVQRDRLAAMDGLDAQTHRDLLEAGVVTATYESTFKDGFRALETYLKDRFQQEAKKVTKPPATTTFQRLQDTNQLKIAKKGSGVPSLTDDDAVDLGLCYGWISGQRKSYDETYYLQKYVPRRPRSRWSQVNVAKVEELIAAGRMRPSGLAEVEAAKADGRWAAAYQSQRTATVPPISPPPWRRARRRRRRSTRSAGPSGTP